MTDDAKLTTLETYLRDGFGMHVATYAGELARADGLPPDAATARAAKLQHMIPTAVTALVLSVRESMQRGMPDPPPEIIERALRELARSLLDAVDTAS